MNTNIAFKAIRRCYLIITTIFLSLTTSFAQGNLGYQAGAINVKFEKSFTNSLDAMAVSRSSQGGIIQTGFPSLDNLNQTYKAVSMERIFPHGGKFEAKHRKHGLHLWYRVKFDNSKDVIAAKSAYSKLAYVKMAEPIYDKKLIEIEEKILTKSEYEKRFGSPDAGQTVSWDDPQLPNQWHYNNTGQTGGTADADIDLFEAWDIQVGTPDVIVAVTDGGINPNHEDLAANMWVNTGEIPGNGIDDDNNGYIDDVNGYNFADNTGTIPAGDHGSHVGGTVAAVNNNATGVGGVAGGDGTAGSGARLMSCVAFGTAVGGFETTYIYAADNGAVISQNSWGYTSPGAFEQVVLDGIDYFIAEAGYDENGDPFGPMQGGIVFVAAGNDATDAEWYPGFYEPTFAVSGSDHNDDIYDASNFGDWIEAAAPGESVLSSTGNSYAVFSGTSMACPHVSGVAALIISEFAGNITPAQVKARLIETAEDVGLPAGFKNRINAYNALLTDNGIAPDAVVDLSVSNIGQDYLDITWTAPADSDNDNASVYEIRYSTSPIDANNFASATLVAFPPTPQPAGLTENFTITGLIPSTTYYVALTSSDFFGNESDISNVVMSTTDDVSELVLTPLLLSETVDLTIGNTVNSNLNISNIGPGPLDYSFPEFVVQQMMNNPSVQKNNTSFIAGLSSNIAKGEKDVRRGHPVLTGAGGPDTFGYTWIDSNEAGGPAASFNDISGTGSAVVTGDDGTVKVTLPFAFPFYDEFRNEIWINGNGFFAFNDISSASGSPSNRQIPTNDAFNEIIAALWDDLDPSAGGAIQVEGGANSFTIQWTDIQEYNGSAAQTVTFQIILYANGAIQINYADVNSAPYRNESTVGIENSAGDDGLQVVFNSTYIEDNLSLVFSPPLRFAVPQTISGTVASGNNIDIPVVFNAAGLDVDVYTQDITLLTNDPNAPVVIIPATMTVTGSAPNIEVAPADIAFDGLIIGFSSESIFTVSNTGNSVLNVTLSVDNSDYTLSDLSLNIPAMESADVTVTFAPTSTGTINGTVTLLSNDPDTGSETVALTGIGFAPPELDYTPTSFNETLDPGAESDQTLTLSNIAPSGANLEYSLGIGDLVNVTASSSSFKSSNISTGPTKTVSSKGVYAQLESTTKTEVTPNAVGDILFSGAFSPGSPLGITMNTNGDIWVADISSGETVRYDDQLNVIETISHPTGTATTTGVAWDSQNGTLWWLNADSASLVEGDTQGDATGNTISVTVSSGGLPAGIEYDAATNAFYYIDIATDDIYAIDRSGNVLTDYPVPQTGYDDGSGLFGNGMDVVGGIFDVLVGTSAEGQTTRAVPTDFMGNNLDVSSETDLTATGDTFINDLVRSRINPNGIVYVVGNSSSTIYAMEPTNLGLTIGDSYLSLSTVTGTIAGGGSEDINVNFNAEGYLPGTYSQDIIISSNDPDEQEVIISTQLIVNGAPIIEVAQTDIDFGETILGLSKEEILIIGNVGNQGLEVTLSVDNSDYSVSGNASFIIPPFSEQEVIVVYAPTSLGSSPGVLTIASNDVTNASVAVNLAGIGLGAPTLTLSSDSFTKQIIAGNTGTETLTVTNTGDSELQFEIQIEDASTTQNASTGSQPSSREVTIKPLLKSGESKETVVQILNTPVQTDEKFFESFEGSFPPAGWLTIDADGDNFEWAQTTDPVVHPPKSGNNTVISASWDSGAGALTPDNYLILPQMAIANGDSLHWFAAGQDPAFAAENYAIMVSTTGTNVGDFTDNIFEETLPDGTDEYNARSVNLSAYAGQSIYIAFRHYNISDMFQLKLDDISITGSAGGGGGGGIGADYLTLNIMQGNLAPNESMEIELGFNATDFVGGVYSQDFTISTNDPTNLTKTVATVMEVTGTPIIDAQPISLIYGDVVVDGHKNLMLTLENTGTDVLDVTDITTSNPLFFINNLDKSFTLLVGEVKEIEVGFYPNALGVLNELLTIESNYESGQFYITLLGIGVPAPEITTNVTTFDIALNAEESTVELLTISNTSTTTDLEYTITKQFPGASSSSSQSSSREVTIKPLLKSGESKETVVQILNTPVQTDEKFFESFEGSFPPAGWLTIDADGDNFEWAQTTDPVVHPPKSGNNTVISASWDSGAGALTPDNYLILPQMAIANGDSLHWFAAGQDSAFAAENYAIMVSTTGTNVSDFTDNIFEETLPDGTSDYNTRQVDLSAYAGQSIYIAFRHYNISDMFQLKLDDISITGEAGGGGGGSNVDYISLNQENGVVAPGESVDIDVTFSAAGLNDGVYNEDLLIETNIPNTEGLLIPTTLTVTGEPVLVIDPITDDLGELFTGTTVSDSVLVANTGSAALTIASSFDNTDFTVDAADASIEVAPDEEQYIHYSFSPSVAGNSTGVLSFTTNETSPGDNISTISATVVDPPIIGANPTEFNFALNAGDTDAGTLTVSNTGASSLFVNIQTIVDEDPAVNTSSSQVNNSSYINFGEVNLEKGDKDEREGHPVLLGTGGPDGFGQIWIDSNEPGGPTYEFTDISTTGTSLSISDDNTNTVALPFNFSHYGIDYNTIYVNTNGFVAVVAPTGNTYTNQQLPVNDNNNGIIAGLWDDLRPITGSSIHVEYVANSFIIQWTGLARWGASGTVTFQIVLYDNGEVMLNYSDVETASFLTGVTVGMENATGDDGLQVVFNAAYLENNLSVKMSIPPAPLVSVDIQTFEVLAGESQDIAVSIDARDVYAGSYENEIILSSNDPANEVLTIPVNVVVSGTPDMAVTPMALDFGTVFITGTGTENVQIENTGTDELNITLEITDGATVYSVANTTLAIAPGEIAEVPVTFAPDAVLEATGELTIADAGGILTSAIISLTGLGEDPPVVATNVSSFSTNLIAGESVTETLTISNTGATPLDFTLSTSDVTTSFEVEINNAHIIDFGDVSLEKDEKDFRVGNPTQSGSGGPDNFGYKWEDSNQSGGPTFTFTDISATGTDIGVGGDGTETIALPFTFPYYGVDYDTIYVNGNGFISVNNITGSGWSNGQIPVNDSYNGVIAGFWDDLEPQSGGGVQVEQVGSTFIIQWTASPKYGASTTGEVTFQIVLSDNGEIHVNYADVEGTNYIESGTVGIENEAGDDGLQVVFNAAYLHNDLTVRYFVAPPQIVVPSNGSVSGTVEAGNSADILVTMDAANLIAGTFNYEVTLASNDPQNGDIAIPVEITVTGTPEIAVDPTSVDFGDVAIEMTDDMVINITNTGTDVLTLGTIELETGTSFTVDTEGLVNELAPGETTSVTVAVNSSTSGAITDNLTINSDDGTNSALVVALSANIIGRGILAVDITSADFEVLANEQASMQMVISNNGTEILQIEGLSLSATAGWFSTDIDNSSYPIDIAAGASMNVTLTADATGLTSSTDATSILLSSNDPITSGTDIEIPVNLVVTEAPAFTTVPVGLQDVNEGELYEFTFAAMDNDLDDLAFSMIAGDALGNGTITTGGAFTFSPDFTQAGTHQFEISVSDGENSSNHIFDVLVNNVNQTPTVENAIEDQILLTEETVDINLANVFNDADVDDVLTYEAVSSNTSALTTSLVGTVLSINGVAIGNATVTVTVTDTNGDSVEETFDVTVEEPLGIENGSFENSVFVAPNPTNGELRVSLNNTNRGEVNVQILNVNGQIIMDRIFIKNSELHNEEIDISEYKSGIYLIRLINNKGEYASLRVKKN